MGRAAAVTTSDEWRRRAPQRAGVGGDCVLLHCCHRSWRASDYFSGDCVDTNGVLGRLHGVIWYKHGRFAAVAHYHAPALDFDHSGSYLAFGGSDIRIYQVASVKSEWNCIKTLPDLSGTGKATCVKFGPDAKHLAVGSLDRNLLIFGLSGDEGPVES
ncbi:hypothetical protein Dimus_021371 [Dionaea muscipula]